MIDQKIKALDHFLNEIAMIPETGKKEEEASPEAEPVEESAEAESESFSPSKAALASSEEAPEMDSEEEYSPEMLMKLFKGMKGAL